MADKTPNEILKEQLCYAKKNALVECDDATIAEAFGFCDGESHGESICFVHFHTSFPESLFVLYRRLSDGVSCCNGSIQF